MESFQCMGFERDQRVHVKDTQHVNVRCDAFQLLPRGGFDVVDRTSNYGYTDARWQQTANYGYLPNEAMRRTFLAVTIDLPNDLPDDSPDENNNQSTHARYDVTSTLSRSIMFYTFSKLIIKIFFRYHKYHCVTSVLMEFGLLSLKWLFKCWFYL